MVRISLVFEGDKELGEYQRYLKLAEKYGVYSFQIYEHLTFRPAWAVAFHIARYVKKTRIGPVTIPVMLYHPAYTAANIATLSEAANGKIVLGISRGAFYEHLSTKPEKPITAVKEAVEIIDILLKGGGEYRGNVFKLSEKAYLKLHGTLDLELYVGSSGPKMIQMASGLNPVKAIIVDNLWNPRYVAKVLENIRMGAEKRGRDPKVVHVIPRPFSCIMKDRDEARRTITKELARYLPALVADSPMLREAGLNYGELLSFAEDPEGNSEVATKIVENFSATGTPDDIIEQTDKMLRQGVEHVCYGHPMGKNVEESVRLIGEKIKPYFSGPEGRG